LARNTIAAIKDRLHLCNFGETLFNCISTDLADGHTPGHPVLEVFSEHQSFMHIVDAAHATFLLAYPEWGTEWDIDWIKVWLLEEGYTKTWPCLKASPFPCHLP
jgi:hypothetical protein